MSTFQILHISDLHVSERDNFDRSVVLDPLISRVEMDIRAGFKPEIVVVTGDVAHAGIKSEYELAKKFFDDLLKSLKLSQDKLFIVPGNHDVNQKKYRPNDIPAYETMEALNGELENEEYRRDLFKGMEDYFSFIEENYPHLKDKLERLIPFVTVHPAACGKKIGLVGLNSAWMCRKRKDKEKDKGKIAIGEYQVKMAMEVLKKQGNADLAITIFHHPLDWLWSADYKICRNNFNNTITLSGHLHDAEGGYTDDLYGSLYQFQAGGAYISPYPCRFQYITFDWEKSEIWLAFRKFDKDNKRWCVEAEKGDDGKKTFPMYGARKKEAASEEPLPEIPENYRTWLSEHCAYMDIDKLRGKSEVIQVKMPEIFVPLFADKPGWKAVAMRDLGKKIRPVNIETLIKDNEFLLIEGHPGSGKTTLLKHLAYSVAQNPPQANGFEGWLPILLFLKDLKGFFAGHDGITSSPSTVEKILAFYCDMTGSGLSLETIKAFCKAKKALFLLDGLDEIEELQRNVVVHSFADFRTQNKGNKLVLSGRPHGAAGAAADRFGTNHVEILPLNSEQTETFIKNWFRYVYAEGSKIGSKNADGMISEIQAHPSIGQFIDNPLMLTAICILYHDGKELPGQRAELYNKFIENMLYRRFSDYEKVREFLMELAFDMHYNRRTKGIDKQDALKVLQKVYKKPADEDEALYRKRIEKLFDEIEPRCGLLKCEHGQYLFWHLTFQEFLTAVCVKDNNNYKETLGQKWGEEWHHEAIELYIGYQSITDRSIANNLVDEVILAEDAAPFRNWLLASKSMLDIHKNRRADDVLDRVRKRLLCIIDTDAKPKVRAEAGEILGWLGDTRRLKEFIRVRDGKYSTSVGEVTLKNFEIGKYPVTNSWFEEFIKAGGYTCKDYWNDEGWKRLYPRYWNERTWRCPNAPVVGVTLYEACAFIEWLTEKLGDGFTYTLPREGEWEAAASGLERREHPWVNGWDKTRCNNAEIDIGKTSPVGIFRNGDTPEGISDMSGNVWEWTASMLYNEEKTSRIVRGGSWNSEGSRCCCANRSGRNSSDCYLTVGFRCARTLKL